MRSKLFIGTGIALAAMALTACGSSGGGSAASSDMSSSMSSQKAMSSSAPMSSGSMMADSMGHGTFEGLNDKHVKGTVMVENGAVRLTGFSSDEGPDLHLYLTNGTDEAAVGKGKELGKVAFDKATQKFDLMDMKTSGYTDVVVHCDKAKAVFGAAALSS